MYNVGDPSNNWIGIELEGVDCNRDAIGTKLTLISKSGTQIAWINPASSYLTSNDKRIVFAHYKNVLGQTVYKFYGVFEPDWNKTNDY